KMTGFVTLGEKNKRANIGIIAIDHSTRGKGVGKLLMQAADDWAFQNNYATIQVITQGENEGACRFYEACGFEQEQLDYFYHIWRD
ncbi:MAG: GNAT family N-acetyltransferase, partial [Flavobacteriales bacterium]